MIILVSARPSVYTMINDKIIHRLIMSDCELLVKLLVVKWHASEQSSSSS